MKKVVFETFKKALLLALTSALLASCGSAPETDENTLLRGNSGEPGTLDPHLAGSTPEIIIINDLFLGLMTQDSYGSVILGAAADYSVSEDGKEWRFTLRDDLVWSDGVAMTSDDFLFSFRRALDPQTASPTASLLYPIKNAERVNTGELDPAELGVSTPDPLTIVFELEEATPYFDKLLVVPASMPVPRHIIQSESEQWSRPPNAVSNGAFKLSSWTPRVDTIVEKNIHFFAHETVKLNAVKYIPTEDLTTQLRRFRAGEIDLGLNFPPSQAEWVRDNLTDSIQIFPILGTYYYPINLASPKLSDINVRRALTIAVDRKILSERLLVSGEVPAYSLVPPGFENYPEAKSPDYLAMTIEERQAEARTLLLNAGFNDQAPLEIEIRYNMTEEHQAVAVAVSAMWNAIGVKTQLLSTESRTHFKDLSIGEYDVGRAAIFPLYVDPTAVLSAFEGDNVVNNYSGYNNPAFDEMIRVANSIMDPAERGEQLSRAEDLAMSDYPVIPIYHYVSKRLVSTRVKGWQNNPTGTHLSRYLWLEEK